MTDTERIKKAIKWLIGNGYAKNQEGMGLLLGYKNKSSFSQVVNTPDKRPADFMDRLCSLSDNLNKDWLLTGEGEMLRSEPPTPPAADQPSSTCLVPLLPIYAQGGSLNDFVTSVKFSDCELVVSPIHGVDFVMTVTGDSMAPDYPNGSQILIKRSTSGHSSNGGACMYLILATVVL